MAKMLPFRDDAALSLPCVALARGKTGVGSRAADCVRNLAGKSRCYFAE